MWPRAVILKEKMKMTHEANTGHMHTILDDDGDDIEQTERKMVELCQRRLLPMNNHSFVCPLIHTHNAHTLSTLRCAFYAMSTQLMTLHNGKGHSN